MKKRHQNVMDKANDTDATQPSKLHFSNIVKEQNMRVVSWEARLLGDAQLVKWTSECLRMLETIQDSGS